MNVFDLMRELARARMVLDRANPAIMARETTKVTLSILANWVTKAVKIPLTSKFEQRGGTVLQIQLDAVPVLDLAHAATFLEIEIEKAWKRAGEHGGARMLSLSPMIFGEEREPGLIDKLEKAATLCQAIPDRLGQARASLAYDPDKDDWEARAAGKFVTAKSPGQALNLLLSQTRTAVEDYKRSVALRGSPSLESVALDAFEEAVSELAVARTTRNLANIDRLLTKRHAARDELRRLLEHEDC